MDPGTTSDLSFDWLSTQTQTERPGHYDDCGVWDSGKGSTTATTYLRLSGDWLKYVSKRGEQYCTGGRNNKWIPVDPQPRPHVVVTSHRYYATLKGSNFKKRVTWFTNLPDCDGKAAVEYQGIHSGTTSPHANGTQSQQQAACTYTAGNTSSCRRHCPASQRT